MLFETNDVPFLLGSVQILLQQYLSVETNFLNQPVPDAIRNLIRINKDDPSVVVAQAMAHAELKRRNEVILGLMRRLTNIAEAEAMDEIPESLIGLVSQITQLPGRKDYGPVKLAAVELLTALQQPSVDARLNVLRQMMQSGKSFSEIAKERALSPLMDFLQELFSSPEQHIREAALEVYIRRVYRAHLVKEFAIVQGPKGVPACTWSFQFSDTPPPDTPVRRGMLVVPNSFDEIDQVVEDALVLFESLVQGHEVCCEDENLNVLLIAFQKNPLVTKSNEREIIEKCEFSLQKNNYIMYGLGIRTVTIILSQIPKSPRYFSFNHCDNYSESPLRRDMRPTFPYLLELTKLAVNNNLERLPAIGRNVQNWLGTEKNDHSVQLSRPTNQTVFFRAISHSDFAIPGLAYKILLRAMDDLELALNDPRVLPSASSNIFIHVLQEYDAQRANIVLQATTILDDLIPKFSSRLQSLRVDNIELRLRIQSRDAEGTVSMQPILLVASSLTRSGQWLKTSAYLEYPDPVTGVPKEYRPLDGTGEKISSMPFPTANSMQVKRASARRVGSTYVYDFLGLLEVSIIRSWSDVESVVAPDLRSIFEAKELILESGNLIESSRPAGSNQIGMVAWIIKMKTPEYPNGREVVLIANDVTFQAGSFGVVEDEFFFKASEYARKRGLPRLYIACNSGARIGLDESLKPKIKVEWIDASNPSLGFHYLYLDEETYHSIPPESVQVDKRDERGETRYVISAIVGNVHGIGVENLRGSGMIAGETSRAYDDIFTLSYITGRTVGIGAYLVRLGQRTIQMQNGPMILTGFGALNKLLGREVYTSQDQLGGPEIMLPNGVTHEVVRQDQEGADAIIRWLSYVPRTKDSSPAFLPPSDPIDRDIEFTPSKTPYDPRDMLAGRKRSDGSFEAGFFDRDSFKEYLSGWGKSVIVGRARLGGIPVGVIAVETRLVVRTIPADPANSESREVSEPQAGQVWFPDSAYKTAQAIEDFNRGENLPLMIFANWRGFSGGTRDMFGEILKYGSMIVDALRTYRHPVFIYIPPNGELRGGAWVVVDPTINEDVMEMYADEESRGGILEPPGICEVKFRKKDQVNLMHRLDEALVALDRELVSADATEAVRIKSAIARREETLLPIYLQIAHEFADLHDRAGRMKAKGVIREQLQWKRARHFFYWRIRRRIAEFSVRNRLQESVGSVSVAETVGHLQTVLPGDEQWWNDDRSVSSAIESLSSNTFSALQSRCLDRVEQDTMATLRQLGPAASRELLERLNAMAESW
uniref:Acetyl-CoA carboxylase n=2 Tax=Compsopogon caeruleus TaxID=31354 RepID=A0A7S1TGV2_9RHOD|mmetsp:Transcript_6750/g.13763  ORF Transcript_6750/g.13763 Transcript_6750/m.13763 type:complete len:1275 (+) Transcript_6750:171-3995(+)